MKVNDGSIEYLTPRHGTWIVMCFDALHSDFAVNEHQMPAFHEVTARLRTPFTALRLAYGIHPLLPKLASNSNLLGAFSISQVAAILKVSPDDVRELLGVVTGQWLKAKEARGHETTGLNRGSNPDNLLIRTNERVASRPGTTKTVV